MCQEFVNVFHCIKSISIDHILMSDNNDRTNRESTSIIVRLTRN